MIHSMAGGVVRENRRLDFAKVRLEDGSVRFYISKIADLQAGDSVIVPADGNFGFQNQFNAAESLSNAAETSTQKHKFRKKTGVFSASEYELEKVLSASELQTENDFSGANFTETHSIQKLSTETHDANTMRGNNTMRGVVLRVDKNVSEQVAPVPVKRCKEILRRCDWIGKSAYLIC